MIDTALVGLDVVNREEYEHHCRNFEEECESSVLEDSNDFLGLCGFSMFVNGGMMSYERRSALRSRTRLRVEPSAHQMWDL